MTRPRKKSGSSGKGPPKAPARGDRGKPKPARRGPAQGAAATRPPREESPRVVGVIAGDSKNGWRIQSTNRRERGDYNLHVAPDMRLVEGQLAVAEKLPSRNRFAREARLIEIVGDAHAPDAVSLIAIAQNAIPIAFSPDALAQANAAQPVAFNPALRVDLRALPLVTIDGPDSRDFDDAVFAEADGPDGEKGWHLMVAIADVAHYVTPGSALDRDAYQRGNSVYFPDRVVPMLPEALSNDLCSLVPHRDRACMAVHLWIDKSGSLTRWQFVRGVMKSHARLTYEQVQAARDGRPDATTAPLLNSVIAPLYGAYKALLAARKVRGTLELDLPERKITVRDGKVTGIDLRERLDSHRLIEEFMILANVAAAAQLEQKAKGTIYRIHDKPSEIKLDALRDFLDGIGIGLVPPSQMHPRFLTRIIENSAGTDHAQVVNEIMLRSQSQAVYSPANIGHFGLALGKYAHFTSPIRRYADLVVHRGLIAALNFGPDGLTADEQGRLQEIADHITAMERRAVMAERDAADRFTTLFMADRVGATFPARISGITRFGLFARLDETGADGIIPMNSLGDDYYVFDEKTQTMIGCRTRKTYRLAQPVLVKLAQADALTGSMSLILVDSPDSGESESAGKPPSAEPAPASKRRRRPRGKG